MKITLRSFFLPKQGNAIHEYEDAFWPQSQGERYGDSLRFAVADGATEYLFSRQWAQRLVALYAATSNPLPNGEGFTTFQKNVHGAARKWSATALSQSLPWHALHKLQQGSFASLLGLTLCSSQADSGNWTAFDSCLFHIRGDELQMCWPITKSDQFGYHPKLIGTDPSRNTRLWETSAQWTTEGHWRLQDTFCLMTDALAHWFLSQYETNNMPWSLLSQFEIGERAFSEWVAAERQNGQLRNDDTTLLIIRVGSNV
jgi:hypothetical protein